MDEITHDELYNEFCEWNPECAKKIIDYKPWGSTSIVVWFNDGCIHKVKRQAPGRFII